MYYKINSKVKGGFLKEKKDDDRVIIVYHWNSCGHCRNFMPILYNLLQHERELLNMANIFEVEYSDFNFLPPELTNVSAFPSVVAIQNGEKVDEFSEQRTPENLSEFIKKNSSLQSNSNNGNNDSTISSYSTPKSSLSLSSSSSRPRKILRRYSSNSSNSNTRKSN